MAPIQRFTLATLGGLPAQAYTERPMVESLDIAGGFSHPSANFPSNWNLAKPPVFRKRLSSGSSTNPFSEVVTIDVRKAQ